VTVADLAVRFPQAIGILNHYHLDYCCNGGRRFVSACARLNLDARSIFDEIVKSPPARETDKHARFETWETPRLINYIIGRHHSYTKEAINHIGALLKKVEAAHAEDSPDVVPVRELFEQLSEELLDHMIREEVIVFPAMRSIAGSGQDDSSSGDMLCALGAMEDEHEEAGVLIKQLRSLTNDYTVPLYACPTFQLTWQLLKEFDEDLMQHIHLENNILFPRVGTQV
jgi:regulator of cell morphogenesis and NO signaling